MTQDKAGGGKGAGNEETGKPEDSKLEADLTVLRAKAFSQVQPPLSDEQVEQIMNAPQERMQPGEPRLNERRGERPPPPREGNDPQRPPRPTPQ